MTRWPARRFLIIAHRGASGLAPESTQAAIKAAGRFGADMIELDVQLTRDGRLIIFHDERLERTTTGHGRVTSHRYAELAQLDAGRWFDSRFAGERILLASQAARLMGPSVWVNMELKSTPHRRALMVRVQRWVRRTPVKNRLLISSFDPTLLDAAAIQHVPRALICHRTPGPCLRLAVQLGCAAWHPLVSLVTPQRIATAHAAGLRVHPWTVDTRALAHRLLQWGADGVFTNHPERLRGISA